MTATLDDATSTDKNDDDLDTELDAEGTATGADDDADPDGADALGDKGKKALDEMKAKWRSERARAKAAEDKIAAAAKKEPDANDLDAIREQIRSDARAEVLRDRALDKIEAKAGGRFKDPEDALLRLGKNVDDYISDGKIDVEAIEDALVELLEKRPDFGIAQGDAKRFKGSADSGPKADAGKPQVTEAQLKNMTPEQIVKAQQEGRLEKLLGG